MNSFRGLLAYTLISVQAFFLMGCDDRYVRSSSSDRDIVTIINEEEITGAFGVKLGQVLDSQF